MENRTVGVGESQSKEQPGQYPRAGKKSSERKQQPMSLASKMAVLGCSCLDDRRLRLRAPATLPEGRQRRKGNAVEGARQSLRFIRRHPRAWVKMRPAAATKPLRTATQSAPTRHDWPCVVDA